MDEPTNEQKGLMANAAIEACYAKAEELGLPMAFGLYGIVRAMSSIRALAMLHGILGAYGLEVLGDALMQKEEADAVRQAEDILKGE